MTVFFSVRRDAPERWVKRGKARARAQAEAKASDRSQTICSTREQSCGEGSGAGEGTPGSPHGSPCQEVLGPHSRVRGHGGNNLARDAPAGPASQGPSPEPWSHDGRKKMSAARCGPPPPETRQPDVQGRTVDVGTRVKRRLCVAGFAPTSHLSLTLPCSQHRGGRSVIPPGLSEPPRFTEGAS